MKIADRETIVSIDKRAVKEFGLSGLQLMENAGRGAADVVLRESGGKCRVAVICGKGNNGGDGFVVARHLQNAGCRVSAYGLAKASDMKGDAAINARIWERTGNEIFPMRTGADMKRHAPSLRHADIVVDAIFGTGGTGGTGGAGGTGPSSDLKGIHAELVGLINKLNKKVVSIDIPSGIDADTGAVMGCAVKADVTATMAMPKPGLLLYPGRGYAGRVEVIDIGVPRSLLESESIRLNAVCARLVKRLVRPRDADTHKGTYGHLLVIAGSIGKTGAAYMSAVAAMRSGAGLVTLGLPGSLNAIMEAKTAEVMTWPLPESNGMLSTSSFEEIRLLMKDKSALLIGPGLGRSPEITGLLKMILREARASVVIDADGLTALKGNLGALKSIKAGSVITPHPGEAGGLLDKDAKDVQRDRLGSALKLSSMTGGVTVLKGASTVVATPDNEAYINTTGNAGLATAGTGDVLSGMIAGLITQGYGALPAALMSVYAHGLAADEHKKEFGEAGMMATDLFARIPKVFNSFVKTPSDYEKED